MKRAIVLSRPGGKFSTISLGLYESGFGGILLLVPLLVIPFLEWGGYIIFAIELGWIVILGVDYVIVHNKEKKT
jgi:hypothetical protein